MSTSSLTSSLPSDDAPWHANGGAGSSSSKVAGSRSVGFGSFFRRRTASADGVAAQPASNLDIPYGSSAVSNSPLSSPHLSHMSEDAVGRSTWSYRGGRSSIRRRRSSAWETLLSTARNALLFDKPKEYLHPLLTEIFENPEHVNAFAEALREDDARIEELQAAPLGGGGETEGREEESSQRRDSIATDSTHDGAARSVSNATAHISNRTLVSHPRRIDRIEAVSDFTPVREKVRKRGSSSAEDSGTREGFVYKVLRWPLLVVIMLIAAVEFMAYVLVRQIVNVIEYSIAWRGQRGVLRKRLRNATTYAEWKATALQLDEYQGFEAWKAEDASGLYDWILITKVVANLRAYRDKGDAENLMGVLELCLRNNMAGIENFRLYSQCWWGTKNLIERYLCEVEESLAFFARTEKIPLERKRAFYRGVSKNFGSSALCLSGGGSLGYYHIGLVKALLDQDLLPNVVTGCSAGGLIAALTCTRTNEELREILVPELADRITACEEPLSVWGPRLWRTGSRFNILSWAEKAMYFTRGSMTFAEAYARTGRVLNISVIPADRHSPVKLLNHITAPDCIIWSSLLASAAVPTLLPPVCLMAKTKSGKAEPISYGRRFKDGSIRSDIPLKDLHSLYNCNFPIVSQVNPHVALWYYNPKGNPGRPVAHRKGRGWRGGFILSAAEHILKLHLELNFKAIKALELSPKILGTDFSNVFLQKFSGAVTIVPKTRAMDFVRLLSDPDRKELARMMRVAQGVTFPKIKMIDNRMRIERAIEKGRKECRAAIRASRRIARERSGPLTPGADDAVNTPGYEASGFSPLTTTGGPVSTPSGGIGAAAAAGGAMTTTTTGNASDGGATTDDFFSAKRRVAASTQTKNRRSAGVNTHHQTSAAAARPKKERVHSLRDLSKLDAEAVEAERAGGSKATTPGESDEGAVGDSTLSGGVGALREVEDPALRQAPSTGRGQDDDAATSAAASSAGSVASSFDGARGNDSIVSRLARSVQTSAPRDEDENVRTELREEDFARPNVKGKGKGKSKMARELEMPWLDRELSSSSDDDDGDEDEDEEEDEY